jgi:hypothetical protein
MKALYLLSFLLFTNLEIFAQGPAWQWAKSGFGNQNDQSAAVTTDASGNIYVTGFFASDSIIFGTYTLYNNGVGAQDMFLVKYDISGNVLWARSIGGSADEKSYAVATDAAGNVYVSGSYYSPVITIGANTYTNAGTVADIFLVKYDINGNVLWSKSEGGPGVEIPFALYVEPSGSMVVAGRFSSLSLVFGNDTLTQAGSMDVFVVKYDASGNVLWATSAGSGSNDEAYALSEDAAENIYVAGYFNQNCQFGTTILNSSGVADMFLAKMDPNGSFLWAKKAGGNGDDRIQAVSTDVNGDSYVAGYFLSDTLTVGSILIPNSGGDNSFIAKFDDNGDVVWTRSINGDSRAQSLTRKGNGLFFCGGFSGDTLLFGSSQLLLDGSSDFYMAGCDTAGNANWAVKQTSGGSSSENALGITIDNTGSIVLAGFFKSHPIAFGPATLNNTVASFDMFVARTCPVSAGIDELAQDKSFLLYPNPATGQAQLKTDVRFWALEIFDTEGRSIYYLDAAYQPDENVLLPRLIPGIYFVRLTGETTITRRLVIYSE